MTHPESHIRGASNDKNPRPAAEYRPQGTAGNSQLKTPLPGKGEWMTWCYVTYAIVNGMEGVWINPVMVSMR